MNGRMLLERAIVRRTIIALLGAGYEIMVHDGEEVVLSGSKDAKAIFGAMFGTDEDVLHVSTASPQPGGARLVRSGWVRFVYGNDGWDVINDYTTNLEETLKPVLDMCRDEKLPEGDDGTCFLCGQAVSW